MGTRPRDKGGHEKERSGPALHAGNERGACAGQGNGRAYAEDVGVDEKWCADWKGARSSRNSDGAAAESDEIAATWSGKHHKLEAWKTVKQERERERKIGTHRWHQNKLQTMTGACLLVATTTCTRCCRQRPVRVRGWLGSDRLGFPVRGWLGSDRSGVERGRRVGALRTSFEGFL